MGVGVRWGGKGLDQLPTVHWHLERVGDRRQETGSCQKKAAGERWTGTKTFRKKKKGNRKGFHGGKKGGCAC